ncbi:hypothetical protein D3C84_689610 [compost metagenome]
MPRSVLAWRNCWPWIICRIAGMAMPTSIDSRASASIVSIRVKPRFEQNMASLLLSVAGLLHPAEADAKG